MTDFDVAGKAIRPVPDPDPCDSVKHLRWILGNSIETFGEDSPCTKEIRQKLAAAERACGRSGWIRTT
jgi:hypothetical protein